MIGFLAARAITGIETVDTDGRYRRSIGLDGAQGAITVEPDRQAAALRVTIRFPRIASLAAIVRRVRRVFDLSADPLSIGEDLGHDPLLAPLVARRPGLRVPGAWDGFELAIRAVLGQQVTVTAAAKLAGKLVAAYGDPLPPNCADGLTHTFPAPERLAAADLRSLGMPAARAQALSSIAGAAVADPRLFSRTQSLDDAVAKLRALRGIGEWTAQYIAMRVLREPDAFPAQDIGLLRALAAPGGERPSADALLARAEAWRPWRAYAAQHLWTADAATRAATSRTNPRDKIDAYANPATTALSRPDRKPDRDNPSHP
jgi:AraC family transcriptional regulator of adaptative response / DNA-3-methyladenine glycosylase II